MRQLNIDLEEILDVITEQESIGSGRSELYTSLFNLIKPLTDEEIEEYASKYLTDEAKAEGCKREDYEMTIATLEELRDEYQKEE